MHCNSFKSKKETLTQIKILYINKQIQRNVVPYTFNIFDLGVGHSTFHHSKVEMSCNKINIYAKHNSFTINKCIQWWFVNLDTFVPGQYFRINEFSGLLNRPSVQKRKLVPALFVRISEISGLLKPGLTNHHCTSKDKKHFFIMKVSNLYLQFATHNPAA